MQSRQASDSFKKALRKVVHDAVEEAGNDIPRIFDEIFNQLIPDPALIKIRNALKTAITAKPNTLKKTLKEYKDDPNLAEAIKKYEGELLFTAIRNLKGSCVKMLLKNGASPNAKFGPAEVILDVAMIGIHLNNEQSINSIIAIFKHLSEGPNVNGVPTGADFSYKVAGSDLLQIVSMVPRTSYRIAKAIIEYGKINIMSYKSYNPILLAAYNYNLGLLNYYLSIEGVDINKCTEGGNTALHGAIVCMNPKYMSVYNAKNSFAPLQKLCGEDVSKKNPVAKVPSVEERKALGLETIGFLLKRGARLDAENSFGETALQMAIRIADEIDCPELLSLVLKYSKSTEDDLGSDVAKAAFVNPKAVVQPENIAKPSSSTNSTVSPLQEKAQKMLKNLPAGQISSLKGWCKAAVESVKSGQEMTDVLWKQFKKVCGIINSRVEKQDSKVVIEAAPKLDLTIIPFMYKGDKRFIYPFIARKGEVHFGVLHPEVHGGLSDVSKFTTMLGNGNVAHDHGEFKVNPKHVNARPYGFEVKGGNITIALKALGIEADVSTPEKCLGRTPVLVVFDTIKGSHTSVKQQSFHQWRKALEVEEVGGIIKF